MQNTDLKELLAGLTDEQKEAVSALPEGFLRISAGAGSGKTEVLTRRIIAMLKSGILPEELVSITYTQKAAAEMKTRLVEKRKVPPYIFRKMEVSTFHAFLSNILKKDPFGAGLDKSDSIVNDTSRQLILAELKDKFSQTFGEEIINGENKLGEEYASKLIEAFPGALNKIRRYILSPQDFFKLAKQKFTERKDEVSELEKNVLIWLLRFFHMYLQELKKVHLYDFDSILIRGKELLSQVYEDGNILQKRVFLIDEFQDNNKEQFDIISSLVEKKKGHITVVGDEKQSIYSFQGADVQNFRDFKSNKDVILKDNFRSYKEILTLSDKYLKMGGAQGQMFVEQHAKLGNSPRLKPIACFHSDHNDDGQDAIEIVSMIKDMIDKKLFLNKAKRKIRYGDIAIVTPSIKKLPREFEDALLANKIPYVMSGGLGFYDRGEINDILSFIKLLANPQDNFALVKILTGPLYGLNDSDLVQLALQIKKRNLSLLTLIMASDNDNIPEKARHFRDLFINLKSKSPKLGILDLCHTIIEQSGFYEYAARQDSELKRRRTENNISKFLSIVRNFEQKGVFTTIRDFLAYIEKILKSDIEETEAGLGLEEGDAIKIMTIHKAKGLEFPVVICPFLSSHTFRRGGNIFFTKDLGLMVSMESASKISEDSSLFGYFEDEKNRSEAENRRKLYVAFTRAEELLILSGTRKNCFPKKKSSKTEPLSDVREIIEANPDIGTVRDISEWSDVLENWLSFGKDETIDNEPDAPEENDFDIEEIKANIETIHKFVCNDSFVGKKKDNEEEIYSLQDMNLFNKCPRKYFFTKNRIQSFKEVEVSQFAIAGTIIHETIRLFHSNNGHLLEFDKKISLIKSIIDKLIPLYGEHGESSKTRILRILEKYTRSDLASKKPFMSEAEINVKFNADSGAFFMRGFIDRVDKTEEEVTKIIDFKTRTFSEKSHLKYEKQAALYLIAAQRGVLGEIGNFNIAEASIAYLSDSGLNLVPITPNILDFENEAIKFVEKVRNETEWFPLESHELCSECGFTLLCNKAAKEAEIADNDNQ